MRPRAPGQAVADAKSLGESFCIKTFTGTGGWAVAKLLARESNG